MIKQMGINQNATSPSTTKPLVSGSQKNKSLLLLTKAGSTSSVLVLLCRCMNVVLLLPRVGAAELKSTPSKDPISCLPPVSEVFNGPPKDLSISDLLLFRPSSSWSLTFPSSVVLHLKRSLVSLSETCAGSFPRVLKSKLSKSTLHGVPFSRSILEMRSRSESKSDVFVSVRLSFMGCTVAVILELRLFFKTSSESPSSNRTDFTVVRRFSVAVAERKGRKCFI